MQALRPGRSGVHTGHHRLALGKKDPPLQSTGGPSTSPSTPPHLLSLL